MRDSYQVNLVCKGMIKLFLGCILWSFTGCNLFNGDSQSPEGYDLDHPILIKLPTELDEISGVVYYPKDTCVFAIVDEVGMLYKIFLNRPKEIQKWRFSEKGDYEDLVLLDSNFYVLKSKGNIAAFRFLSADTLAFTEFPFPLGQGNEFEILYYDPSLQKLMMICKDCEVDKKKHLSSFAFDPFMYRYDSDRFVIDVTRIAELAGEEKMKFKPSAAAINPITGELFIISAINKLLVVADAKGTAKRVYKITHGDFKQPEGICFKPDGTLIISNEASDEGVANIQVFPYKPK